MPVTLTAMPLSAAGSCDAFSVLGTPKESELGVPELGSELPSGARQTRTLCPSDKRFCTRRQPLSRSQVVQYEMSLLEARSSPCRLAAAYIPKHCSKNSSR